MKCPGCGEDTGSVYGYFDKPKTMRCNACLDRRERWVKLAMLAGLLTAALILIILVGEMGS